LADIPVVGPSLFQHYALVYIAMALVPVCYVVIFKTMLGLKITAVGENPRAAETAGVNVHAVRYFCVILGAVLAGLAGTALSLGQLNMFRETMIAGRGFIAIAVVMFGRWNPVGALGAALLFGLAEATQIRLQALGMTAVPPQLLVSLPYLVTLIVVLSSVGRAITPRALCVPYVRRDGR
jgi:simple sugar transport system permease protein